MRRNHDSQSVYATLGPAGTNHDLVLRTYLAERNVSAGVELYADIDDALNACVSGEATHMMICAAHPDAPRITSTAQYAHGILLVESFLAESQPLAILTRQGVETPKSIGLHPATRGYADLSGYRTVREVASTVVAFQGLAEGLWDSALTAARFASEADVSISMHISPPRDAWLILSGEVTGSSVLTT